VLLCQVYSKTSFVCIKVITVSGSLIQRHHSSLLRDSELQLHFVLEHESY
jgi:hypothetical protein